MLLSQFFQKIRRFLSENYLLVCFNKKFLAIVFVCLFFCFFVCLYVYPLRLAASVCILLNATDCTLILKLGTWGNKKSLAGFVKKCISANFIISQNIVNCILLKALFLPINSYFINVQWFSILVMLQSVADISSSLFNIFLMEYPFFTSA